MPAVHAAPRRALVWDQSGGQGVGRGAEEWWKRRRGESVVGGGGGGPRGGGEGRGRYAFVRSSRDTVCVSV